MAVNDRVESCNEAACELLISPIPRPKPRQLAIVERASKRRVVLCDTRKPNSMSILQHTKRLLEQRGIEVAAEIFQKADASRPMEDPVLDRLAKEVGLLVLGVAD